MLATVVVAAAWLRERLGEEVGEGRTAAAMLLSTLVVATATACLSLSCLCCLCLSLDVLWVSASVVAVAPDRYVASSSVTA